MESTFEKAQRYLQQLLGYLEGMYSALEPENEGGAAPGLPPRMAQILSGSGYLEGLRLKAQGCLSSDLQEFIRSIGFAFEMEAVPRGAFKLPFVDNELALQRKTLNPFMAKAWPVYHAALLSAYALRPLRFEKLPSSPADPMEEVLRVTEGAGSGAPGPGFPGGATPDDSAGMEREARHRLNNALGGITSYVSLILAERKSDADLQKKLGVVLEAAAKAGEVVNAKPA
jgi:hypothetical protein